MDNLERVAVGGSVRDTLREMQYAAKEAEYYRHLYEEVVPRYHRAPSYAAVRSSRSMQTHSRMESRGVTELSRHDLLRDLGAGTSAVRPSASGDSHT